MKIDILAIAVHPDDVERTLALWRRAWEGSEGYEIEYRFRRHDGAYRWFVGRATCSRRRRRNVDSLMGPT